MMSWWRLLLLLSFVCGVCKLIPVPADPCIPTRCGATAACFDNCGNFKEGCCP